MDFRQGDVFCKAVTTIPKDAQRIKQESVVLAYGEVTGHAHRFSGHVEELQNPSGERFFRVSKQATLRKLEDNHFEIVEDGAILFHEEHDPITPAVGDYQIIQQKEYELQSWRNVID